jgi:1,4-alpha-glucan branching enzyme
MFVINATPVVRSAYRVGVKQHGFYEEVLNTDAGTYGGGNVGNYGGRWSDEHWSWQNSPHSILIDLPPLSVCAFKHKA